MKHKNDNFTWAVGIEDTFIPDSRPRLRSLDEYQLTQHYEQWQGDLKLVLQAGVTHVRWGVPWYRIERTQGSFDWSWVDKVVAGMKALGIHPIVDIIHYGTPDWLEGSFLNPSFPNLAARFARQMALRYGDYVKLYTPVNEPTVTADFCGRRAEWPPYEASESAYARILVALARAVQLITKEIRDVVEDATIFAVEATSSYRAIGEGDQPACDEIFLKDLLCLDLASGRVDERHPLHAYLIENGVEPGALQALLANGNAAAPDVLGVNFYPWSCRKAGFVGAGKIEVEPDRDDGRRIQDVLVGAHKHAGLPVFITETSAVGERRESWLKETVAGVEAAQSHGTPVVGYTWFPLFTMIEWDYRRTEKPIDDHLLDLGLFEARFTEGEPSAGRSLVRRETAMVSRFRDQVEGGLSKSGKSGNPKALWKRLLAVVPRLF